MSQINLQHHDHKGVFLVVHLIRKIFVTHLPQWVSAICGYSCRCLWKELPPTTTQQIVAEIVDTNTIDPTCPFLPRSRSGKCRLHGFEVKWEQHQVSSTSCHRAEKDDSRRWESTTSHHPREIKWSQQQTRYPSQYMLPLLLIPSGLKCVSLEKRFCLDWMRHPQ